MGFMATWFVPLAASLINHKQPHPKNPDSTRFSSENKNLAKTHNKCEDISAQGKKLIGFESINEVLLIPG
jgi:hypothetical protein